MDDFIDQPIHFEVLPNEIAVVHCGAVL